MSVTERIRKAVIASGETHYRINKETGIDTRVLDRFVRGGSGLRSGNIDRLCAYLGLQLVSKQQTKRASAPKRPAKKKATARGKGKGRRK
ncbi:MAG: hypothetical protein IH991_01625 [Planctomycetes bacterium]|nr:hypothetical protein [Planctomycetota bacterium]